MRKIIKYHTLPGFSPGGFHPKTIYTSWDSWRLKKQMGAGGHQLEPVSQVTVRAIVTSRLEPRVYIPRSCSGSARSCPFTSKAPLHWWIRSWTRCNYTHSVTELASGLQSRVSSDDTAQSRAVTYLCPPKTSETELGDNREGFCFAFWICLVPDGLYPHL